MVFGYATSIAQLAQLLDIMGACVGVQRRLGPDACRPNGVDGFFNNVPVEGGDYISCDDEGGPCVAARRLASVLLDGAGSLARLLGERLYVFRSQEVFREVVEAGMLRQTRVRLDPVKKVVEAGALWTEEYVPQATVFAGIVAARSTPRVRAEEAMRFLENQLAEANHTFFIGGKETIGKGFARISLHRADTWWQRRGPEGSAAAGPRGLQKGLLQNTRVRSYDSYEKPKLIRSLVTDIMRVIEGSAKILPTRLWSPPLTGCAGLGAYSGLVEVVAETVYRAKPGSSVFLLPLESGLSLHPVFLVPFVLGSSVKGVVRAAFLEDMVLRGLGRDEAERCANAVFGDAEAIGVSSMVFMDAYPVDWGENGLLWGDVVTPHYRGANAEWEARPVPAVGLSIAPGARFRFTVLVEEWLLRQRLCDAGCCDHVPGEGLELAAYLLVYALEHVGLGGRPAGAMVSSASRISGSTAAASAAHVAARQLGRGGGEQRERLVQEAGVILAAG